MHAETHSELIQAAELLAELRADLEPHLQKEEQVLVPMTRSLATASSSPRFHCGSMTNPITVVEQEHAAVGSLLERLRQITGGHQAPPDTCRSTRALMADLAELEADTPLRVQKEHNPLFPGVLALESALAA